jgi:hypothetical protein
MEITLNWSVTRGRMNGRTFERHMAQLPEAVFPAIVRDVVFPGIFVEEGRAGVTLVINGYRFECPSVEAAKAEAVDRLSHNKGIYLPQVTA